MTQETQTFPTYLGRYRLLRAIGHGGMADVFLAVSQGPAGFSKLAVIKQLRPALALDPGYVEMFLDEARLSARLHHPHIVQTNEVGEIDGNYFIAMEYLDGQPLHKVLQRSSREPGSLSLEVHLRILADVLAGLHCAHELRDLDGSLLGIVHRDATPQNVFVTYDGQVKVLDFGIAKNSEAATQTATGTFKGKVAYVSPEQASGGAIDRRADIFSVGVMLWEASTGRRLWGKMSEVEILLAVSQGKIPDPSEVDPGVPTSLARICMKALALRPEDRFDTAADMQAELEKLANAIGERVAAREIGRLVSELFRNERTVQRAEVEEQLRALRGSGPSSTSFATSTTDPLDSSRTPVSRSVSASGAPHSSSSTGISVTRVNLEPTKVELTPRIGATRRPSPRLFVAASVICAVVIGGLIAKTAGRPTQSPEPHAQATNDHLHTNPEGTTVAGGQAQSPNSHGAPDPCGAKNKPVVELTGDIERNSVLSCQQDYLLKFTVRVLPGVTLTIEPGTTLRGDHDTKAALVVQPGGRLIADGRRDTPIVFTSQLPEGQRKPGDWGGIILLGNAPTNLRDAMGASLRGSVEGLTHGGKYGGTDPDDDSGILRFVRIEYSGTQIAPNNEINGLTLAGVGRKTVLDHILVRHTADDCFEFFGGTVNGKHLVCQRNGDDGFDWDYGYTGKLQFLIVQEDPSVTDETNGFEGDNDPNASANTPLSEPTIYNATLCGKGRPGEREQYGMLLRRGTRAHIFNTLVTGFDAAVDIRDRETKVELKHSFFFANLVHNIAYPEQGNVGVDRDDDGGLDELALLKDPTWKNRETDVGLRRCFDLDHPDFTPTRDVVSGAIAPPDDGFFDASAKYVGAMRNQHENWYSGRWVE